MLGLQGRNARLLQDSGKTELKISGFWCKNILKPMYIKGLQKVRGSMYYEKTEH